MGGGNERESITDAAPKEGSANNILFGMSVAPPCSAPSLASSHRQSPKVRG